jgi:DNA polymerase elongation subunit (family B)
MHKINLSYEIDEVESVEFLNDDFQDVYDIGMVDTPHTFFANDILVHNSVYVSCGRLLKSTSFKPSEELSEDILNQLKEDYKVDKVEQVGSQVIFTTKDKATQKDKQVTHEVIHESIIDVLNRKIEPFIQTLINETMVNYSVKSCNCKTNRLSFKRESICKSAIFVEKKKYAMWLLNDEGNVPVDKLKVTGLDIVRSTTPTVAKKVLKDIVFDILRKMDRSYTVNQLREVRDKFISSSPNDIAFNSPVNGLDKYKLKYDENNAEYKSTPKHVRAALVYNNMLKGRVDLQNKYDFIYNGDKIKHLALKTSHNCENNVIAFKGKWVTEFDLDNNIDYDQQFQVAVLNLMEKLFKLNNWELPRFDCYDFDSIFS